MAAVRDARLDRPHQLAARARHAAGDRGAATRAGTRCWSPRATSRRRSGCSSASASSTRRSATTAAAGSPPRALGLALALGARSRAGRAGADRPRARPRLQRRLGRRARCCGSRRATAFDYEWARVQHTINCRLATGGRRAGRDPARAPRALRRDAGEAAPLRGPQGGVLPRGLRARRARCSTSSGSTATRPLAVVRTPPAVSLYHRFENPLFAAGARAPARRAGRRAPAHARAARRAGARRRLHRPRAGDRRAVADRLRRPRDLGRRDDEPRGGRARHAGVDDVRGPARRGRRAADRRRAACAGSTRAEDVVLERRDAGAGGPRADPPRPRGVHGPVREGAVSRGSFAPRGPIHCSGCAAGSAPRPSRSTAMRCRRWRWTRGWSRSPTTWPTGCGSTAASPPRYTDLFAAHDRVRGARHARLLRAGRRCTGTGCATRRSASTCRSLRASCSPCSRSSATSRSSSPKLIFAPVAASSRSPCRPACSLLLGLLMAVLLGRHARSSSTSSTSGRCSGFRAPRDARRVLIVGAGDGGRLLLRELLRNPELRLRPVGFVDDDPRKQGMRMDRGLEVLGTTVRARPRARRRRARRGADRRSRPRRARCAPASSAPAATRGVPVRTMPTVFELLQNGGRLMRQVREVRVEDVLGREPGAHGDRARRRLPDRPLRAGHRRRRLDRLGAVPPDRARRARRGSCSSTTPRTTCSRSSASWSRTATSLDAVAVLADCKEEERMREVFAEHRPERRLPRRRLQARRR